MIPITDEVRPRLRAIQQAVREHTGVDLTEAQILDVHVRALEPQPLADAIVAGLLRASGEFLPGRDDEL